MNYFELEVLGLKRQLPVVPAPNGVMIAGFNPVGDMELLQAAGKNLAKQIRENKTACDVLLTTELKGLPVAQEVARNLGLDYVCLRKVQKCYMANARQTQGESITSGKSNYFVSEADENKLIGKNVVFVDDVFSTGSTIKSMLAYSKKAGFTLTATATILKEDSLDMTQKMSSGVVFDDLPNYFCGFLPLQS